MSKSLQKHGIKEISKQICFRMKKSGLDTIKVQVTRNSGKKFTCNFTGSAEQVATAEQILTAW